MKEKDTYDSDSWVLSGIVFLAIVTTIGYFEMWDIAIYLPDMMLIAIFLPVIMIVALTAPIFILDKVMKGEME